MAEQAAAAAIQADLWLERDCERLERTMWLSWVA